ncbi:MAG TPA: DUF362 domain-containing protein [Methanomicrobiales archaeon]|nr:DUF362 domain-containing protein [Methanomicrobiales archaeon]
MTTKYQVSIARCATYDPDAVRQAVAAALEPLGGMGKFVGKGDRVLVKPNLLASRSPDQAVTTHPAVAQTVVELVQQAGGVPVLGDSPGGRNVGSSYERLLARTGMAGVASATGCEIVSFDEASVEVQAPDAKSFKRFTVAKAVTDADRVIVLPKLKTHQLTYYTGAVKILYGYIPGLTKAEYHLHTDAETFSDLLLDLHSALPPTLAVMDAVVGMEGQGPSNGSPRQVGLVLASGSCTALDLVACSIIGFDPRSVPTVRKAADRGIGPVDLGEVFVSGEPVGAVRIADFARPRTMILSKLPPSLVHAVGYLVGTRPSIRRGRCISCGKCAEACPPKAIRYTKGEIPSIRYRLCIRCYCCQELCPQDAVEVAYPWIRRVVAGRKQGG